MFSKYKGQFEYLKKQPVRIGLLTLVLLIACAGVFMIGFITKGDIKNIFTVIAVLGMLPVAKLIVSFIMYIKAESFTCPKELYNQIEKLCEGKDIAYGYDFYLTSYKINFPILSCLVYDGSLIAYLPDNKNIKECKEHIEKYLSNNSITGIKVYVLDNKDKFLDRFTNIPSDYVQNDSDRSAFALIKNLSL